MLIMERPNRLVQKQDNNLKTMVKFHVDDTFKNLPSKVKPDSRTCTEPFLCLVHYL